MIAGGVALFFYGFGREWLGMLYSVSGALFFCGGLWCSFSVFKGALQQVHQIITGIVFGLAGISLFLFLVLVWGEIFFFPDSMKGPKVYGLGLILVSAFLGAFCYMFSMLAYVLIFLEKAK